MNKAQRIAKLEKRVKDLRTMAATGTNGGNVGAQLRQARRDLDNAKRGIVTK